MITKTVLQRFLYTGTGFVIFATLILTFLVIPSVIKDTSPHADPGRAVPGILIVILIHLSIVAALVWTIRVNQRGNRISKGLLIVLGVLLLLLSIMVLDGATAYSDHADPVMKRVAVSMFICTGCNFFASILSFLTAWFSGRLQPPAK